MISHIYLASVNDKAYFITVHNRVATEFEIIVELWLALSSPSAGTSREVWG